MDKERINSLFKNEGFLKASYVDLKTTSPSFEIYKAQVKDNNIGNMNFLKSHLSKKDPNNINYKSAFVGIYPYYPIKKTLDTNLRVALYAQTQDYHFFLKEKLENIIKELVKDFPDEKFEPAIDSKPVHERDLAYRAGLGWIGKNTCLLNKEEGSLFFIAEILSSYRFNSLNDNATTKILLQTDHCGTCTKCIDACPTDALTPRKMIVEKCISYKNIESKSYQIDDLIKNHNNWFFGCDICQTVCPWNEKAHGKDEMASLSKTPVLNEQAMSEIKEILSSSNKSLEKKFRDFPFSRARGKGLKRNALWLIYENKLTDFVSFLENLSFENDLEALRLNVIDFLKNT